MSYKRSREGRRQYSYNRRRMKEAKGECYNCPKPALVRVCDGFTRLYRRCRKCLNSMSGLQTDYREKKLGTANHTKK